MEINQIKIGERYRKDMGDLAALADNIKAEGLLQPIGVTPQDDLVFGYRRLLACRDMLGWAEIDTRVVNVTSIAAGEYAENEMRKNFTVSERVAILETIKLRHRGQPKKYSEPAPNSFKTREDAARLAGLGNTTTAREATVIVNHGIPELREAVDRSEIGIEPASLIAQQTQEQQAALLKMPKQERNAVLRQFRPASKHNSRKAQQAQPAVPPPRPSRFGGPRPAIHHLSPEQRGMPSAEEMNDQALGQPQGVTKAILHQRKYGHVQLWEPAEAALIELDRRAREFSISIHQLALADAFEPPEIAGLTQPRASEFRRIVRQYLPLVQARLAAFAAAFLDEQTHETMDPAVAAC